MILAASLTDTPYRIMYVLHILAVIVAFAPAFVHPVLGGQLKGDNARSRVLELMTKNGMRIHGSALIVVGILGFGLAGMSDDLFKMSQGWLIASFIVWVAMNGVLHGMIIPSEKKVAAGDESAEQRLNMGGGAITILLLVMLYLMTFKPGL